MTTGVELQQRYGPILARLDRFRADHSGMRGTARCPVARHGDRNPSLSWWISEKGDLCVLCRKGCPFHEIASSLGCDEREFWRPTGKEMNGTATGHRRPAKQHMQPSGHWDYKDEEGVVLYRKLRWATGPDGLGKTYTFQSPSPKDGKWRNGLEGVRRVPYMLDALAAPANAGRMLCIPEGEKCCDALAELGLLATTNDDGAHQTRRSWRPEYTRIVLARGPRPVCVMADSDANGEAWAADVVGSLLAAGLPSVRLLRVKGADGWDVADVIAELRTGGNGEEAIGRAVRQMIRSAPEWVPVAHHGRAA